MALHPLLTPDDDANATLLRHVHPPDWVNPEPAPRYNLVVIGAGTAGLVSAAGAAGLGARVALVERHLMGGDCLNTGCVPSKAILRSALAVGDLGRAPELGVHPGAGGTVDFGAVMERMRRLRARIAPHDSAQRFRDLGVDVFFGNAAFTRRNTIAVGDHTLRFHRAVIATGARAVLPAIPGLAETGCLTSETVFSLSERPRRLAVIGGGPVGCELAQAFRRLGSEVVLIHRSAHLLPREDDDAAAILQDSLRRDGVELVLGARVVGVRRGESAHLVRFTEGTAGAEREIEVDEILAGVGRAPNVEELGLEVAGVRFDTRRGVIVDDHLRTANRRIFAAGDVCMDARFTHAADFAARLVIQNALFAGRKRLSSLTIPWCTYTDPEIAHVGLHEREAKARGLAIRTFVRHLREVDRALVDGDEDGFVKIHVRAGTDRIVGATIVARHAGDLISEISVAMAAGMGLGRLAGVIHPYPTQAEAIRQIGDAYNRTRLTPFVRSLFRRWLAWTG